MPDLEKMTGMNQIVRRIQPIFFVIDTSENMMGARIATINRAMTEALKVLKEVWARNPNLDFKIGVLQFGSTANWVTGEDGLVSMEDFVWSDLEAGGLANLGSALDELKKKLSRSAFLNSEAGYKWPVLFFMSDGGLTDDYKAALKIIIDKNEWYKGAIKIAIAVDDESDIDVLSEITGNQESVIRVTDLEALKKLFVYVDLPIDPTYGKSRPRPTAPTTVPPAVTDLSDWEGRGDWS